MPVSGAYVLLVGWCVCVCVCVCTCDGCVCVGGEKELQIFIHVTCTVYVLLKLYTDCVLCQCAHTIHACSLYHYSTTLKYMYLLRGTLAASSALGVVRSMSLSQRSTLVPNSRVLWGPFQFPMLSVISNLVISNHLFLE